MNHLEYHPATIHCDLILSNDQQTIASIDFDPPFNHAWCSHRSVTISVSRQALKQLKLIS